MPNPENLNEMNKQRMKLINNRLFKLSYFNCNTKPEIIGIKDQINNSVEEVETLIECKLKRER